MPPLRSDARSRLLRCPVIALDGSLTEPGAGGAASLGAKWVQIAYEGEFKGHAAGEFTLTPEVFAQAVANFHAHPSYKPGAEQAPPDDLEAGRFDVIPWDFHHASEQAPTTGTIPVAGAPAQGWVLELQVRTGPDGKAQLWAFTRWLEPLRSYVAEGKYRWCSMTLYPNATDPVSGADVGPYISSVAATNDPFLQGMVPLAASRAAGRMLDMNVWPAETPENAVRQIRSMLEIPATSGVDVVQAEIAKLVAWAAGAATPPVGVELSELVAGLRRILSLPLTTDGVAVLAEATKLIAGFAAEEAEETPPSSRPLAAPRASGRSGPANGAVGSDGHRRDSRMDPTLKVLAERLGIPAEPEAVQKAVVIRLEAGESATTGLKSILGALGVEDVDGATAKIAQMFKQVDELEKAMPELSALREQKAATEEEKAEEEVGEAMQAHRMPPSAKVALLHLRRSNPDEFRKTYPRAPRDKAHLTQSIFAGGSAATQLGATHGSTPLAPPPAPGGSGPINLSAYAGRNVTEQALAYLDATDPNAKKMSSHERYAHARRIVVSATA